ncbi:MAG: hypothetical protein R3309_03395, partial [Reinekea sp.]|nr:hypothetical protein [Reinekea sp.]
MKLLTVKKHIAIGLMTLFTVSIASQSQAFLLGLLAGPNPIWGFINNVNIYKGHMYARGIYTDENGNMVYVVYDETGKEIEEIGPIEEGGDFEKSVLMAAKEYNQYVLHYEQQLQSFEDFYGPDVTVEPELLTAEEYEARRGSLVVVDENNTPWNGDAATHNLRDSTRSVLVLPESLLYTETTQYLLAQYPVDLTANHEELPDDISSLIIGFDGKILQQRKDRISLRSIFFEDTSKGAGDPARFDSTSFTYRQDATNQNLELVSPIKGIPLFINMGFYGGTTTNDDGRFGLGVLGPPCPMFYYDTPIQLEAQLPYRPFNPSQYGSSVYYLTKQVYFSCNGYGPMMTTYITSTDFVVDVNLLNGEFLFPNIELSSSADNPSLVYDFKEPDAHANGDEGSRFEYITFDKYDFDLDGEYDIAECGKLNDEGAFVQLESGEECGKDHIQGIYLSGHSERPGTCTDTDGDGQVNPEDPQCQPQFTRLIDTKKVSEDIGLVKKMAQEHVQDTDLFIVRQSTGQLVAMRQGLKDDEKAYGPSRNDIQATEDEVKADFRMLMRGPKSHVSRSFQYSSLRSETHGFSQWQQDSNMAPELQQLDDADHLRTGEMLEIWAINRVTGYIGKAELEMTPGQITNGILDTVVPTIEMRPPNLKIWAERVYDIEAGMTKGEQRRYLIGNEGIGEADDTFIQINVEWYDEDGSALPDALSDYGYTGRLAYVSGANSLTEASQAGNARFAIEPGTHVELVRLSGNIDNQHYYVQVNAVPEGEFDDFGLAGNSGATQNRSDDATFEEVEHNLYRPERFVPFKTPQFNEELTQIQSQAYLLEKRRRIEAEESVEDMITPQPLHEWFYRPDYQFSVYDLEVDKIETQYKDAFGQTITTDVYELDKPILTSSLDILKFLVDLEGSSQQPLERFDGSQSLVLGIGEQELEVNVSANQTIEFTNFDHLGSLEPDDYLTMRIYSNEDASNLLWQFAFEYLDYYALIDDDVLPSAEDGAVEISADTPEVDLLAHLVGFATRDPENKYEVVMRWEKLGAGALDTTYDSDDEYAIFRNKLTLPTNAGATATITARLTTDGESTSAPLKFRVVAGEAASIALTPLSSTPLYIGGKGSVRYRGVARDQYGNPVQDGTGVSISTDGSVQIISQPESTVNGEFYFEASGADFAEAAALDIRVGDTNQSVDLEILPVDIEFTGLPSEIPAGSTNTFQVRLSANGSPLDNFDLDIWTDKGRLDKSIYTTDGNGQVEVQLIAPSYQSNVTVKVMAAMQAPSEITVTAIQQIGGAGSPAISEQFATLIGDKDVEEAFNFTRWDNEAFSVNKAVSGSIEVFGTEGESLTVSLGNVFEPNRLVQAAYWMNETSQAIDEVGFSNGILENVGLADDTRLSAGKSFRFSPAWGLSRAKISDATRIQLANSNGFVIDYKPVNYGGSIFNLGSGLVLESLVDGRIRLTANTADGSYSVESSQTLPKNQWAQIAGQFNDG